MLSLSSSAHQQCVRLGSSVRTSSGSWGLRRRACLGVRSPYHSVRCFFSPSPPLCGMEQVKDVPKSTDRKPSGFHRGPGKRQTSEKEAASYQFIKKFDLQMRESWDHLEPFQGLPKPKKLLGNEATEIIWPYAVLLERVVKVHSFTKSIYVYYSHRQCTEQGKRAAEVARAFSHRYLVPITFHNSQVHIETEILIECNETPWIVVHCLDGRHHVMPIRTTDTSSTPASAAAQLLKEVVKVCEDLGSSVQDTKHITSMLNERPLQNQYLRIDYQWFGDTPEERASHLVQWEFQPQEAEPILRSRSRHVLNWLNYDGNLPTAASVHINVKREKARMQLPRTTGGATSFFNSAGSRANARNSRFGGPLKS